MRGALASSVDIQLAIAERPRRYRRAHGAKYLGICAGFLTPIHPGVFKMSFSSIPRPCAFTGRATSPTIRAP